MSGLTLTPTLWPRGQRTVASITFDGGYDGTTREVFPVLDAHEVSATWFLVAGSVGGSLESRLVTCWSRWRDRLATSDDEIGNHSLTHGIVRDSLADRARWVASPRRNLSRARRVLHRVPRVSGGSSSPRAPEGTRLSPRDAFADAQAGRTVLEWQMDVPVRSYAYPSGRERKSVSRALRRSGHIGCRTTRPAIADAQVELSAVPSFVWERSHTLDDQERTLDDLAINGGWLVDTFHVVEAAQTDYTWSTTTEVFERRVEAILDLSVPILTFGQVAGHIHERNRWREPHAEALARGARWSLRQARTSDLWVRVCGSLGTGHIAPRRVDVDGVRTNLSSGVFRLPAGARTVVVDS